MTNSRDRTPPPTSTDGSGAPATPAARILDATPPQR